LAGTDGLTAMTKALLLMLAIRYDVVRKIEFQVIIESHIDYVRWGDQQKCVPVRRRSHDELCADIGACAGLIFNDDGLTEPLRQLLAHEARDDVGRNASGIWDDDVHRTVRIGLRTHAARHSRKGSSERGQTQNVPTGEI
jgi:hypothetical protein